MKYRMHFIVGLMMIFGSVHASATLIYPDDCVFLQDCIDAAIEHEIIEIATDIPINENLIIDKSLTLTSAVGYSARIGDGLADRVLTVADLGFQMIVVLDSIYFDNTTIAATFDTASNHNFKLVNSVVYSDSDLLPNSAVSVDLTVPGSVNIHDNSIISTGYGLNLTSVSAGIVDYSVYGNTITSPVETLSDVGILISHQDSDVFVDVQSNIIYSLTSCVSCDAIGISIENFGGFGSTPATVNLINNTIDDIVGSGVFIETPGIGTDLVVNLYNNLMTHINGEGVFVTTSGTVAELTLNNDYNNYFDTTIANDYGGYAQGINTFSVDPLYFNATGADYRLSASSDLINAGNNTPNGESLVLYDADGNTRVMEGIVDIGALEAPPLPPRRRSGGGSMGMWMLFALLLFFAFRYPHVVTRRS